jgi:hypothetical protein
MGIAPEIGIRFPAGVILAVGTIRSLQIKYRVLFPPGVKRQVREAEYLNLESRLRMVEQYLHSPIRLHGVVFNNAQG